MMVFYWNVVEKAQVAAYRDTMEGHRAQQSCSPPGLASPGLNNSSVLQEVVHAVIITEWNPVESEGHFFVAIRSQVCA